MGAILVDIIAWFARVPKIAVERRADRLTSLRAGNKAVGAFNFRVAHTDPSIDIDIQCAHDEVKLCLGCDGGKVALEAIVCQSSSSINRIRECRVTLAYLIVMTVGGEQNGSSYKRSEITHVCIIYSVNCMKAYIYT